jgi:hypothetical protein
MFFRNYLQRWTRLADNLCVYFGFYLSYEMMNDLGSCPSALQ